MLEYWYFFLAIFAVMVVGLVFFSAVQKGLRDVRYRFRLWFNVGFILMILGLIGLFLIIIVEGFFS